MFKNPDTGIDRNNRVSQNPSIPMVVLDVLLSCLLFWLYTRKHVELDSLKYFVKIYSGKLTPDQNLFQEEILRVRVLVV